MDAIVFTSNTGFTEKYARLLAAETGLPVYSLSAAESKLSPGADIVYLGWLAAGSVKGYKSAARRFRVRALCGVGMAEPTEKGEADLRQKCGLAGCPVYLLPGGYAPEKLRGLNKLVMGMVTKSLVSGLNKKPSLTAEEAETREMLLKGGDKVRAEHLAPLISWLQTAK